MANNLRLPTTTLSVALTPTPLPHSPGKNRAEKYAWLQEQNAQKRQAFVQWLDEQDFSNTVVWVSDSGSLDMLFVEVTDQSVASRLKEAPGVKAVKEVKDIPISIED